MMNISSHQQSSTTETSTARPAGGHIPSSDPSGAWPVLKPVNMDNVFDSPSVGGQTRSVGTTPVGGKEQFGAKWETFDDDFKSPSVDKKGSTAACQTGAVPEAVKKRPTIIRAGGGTPTGPGGGVTTIGNVTSGIGSEGMGGGVTAAEAGVVAAPRGIPPRQAAERSTVQHGGTEAQSTHTSTAAEASVVRHRVNTEHCLHALVII